MNWSHYVFIFYIFVLVAMLIYIWTKASKGKVDERIRQLEEKQREIIVLQNDTKDAIVVFETYMYEAKENLENERKKIEYLISKFEDMLEEQKERDKREAQEQMAEVIVDISSEKSAEKEEENSKGDLYDEISKLSKKGYSLDEIVKKLGISKGEANFILGITK